MGRGAALLAAFLTVRVFAPWWCGRDAEAWYQGAAEPVRALAEELVAFEPGAHARASRTSGQGDRFAGEWALVTHQMTALGLAQLLQIGPEPRSASAASGGN